jgi:hypothetical protein
MMTPSEQRRLEKIAADLLRDGKMPSLDQVVAAIDETRQKYRPLILAARQKESAGSKREREESEQANWMQTSGSLQELIEAATVQVSKLSQREKAEYRAAILAAFLAREKEIQSERTTGLRLTGADVEFLKKIKIDPSGD